MDGTVGTAWTWGWSSWKGSGSGGRSRENGRAKWLLVAAAREEHAEPLGSLGLNGAGDDPVDEFIPTGGDDL
ncbi:zinc finger family protein [Dorcoceras hygrometricum]|uniref:Zinc finger family protein n=1 Tax=Dorcoceras hygrometricum TaxID=472368 RepID=A0A2Z7AFT8_9LAMI|nr:zinc finger family protein [Dorcoceras hygrometricum]